MREKIIKVATAVYCIAAVVFFILPPAMQDRWIWIPVAVLALTCALWGGSIRWSATIALIFSALGDVFGGLDMFLPQVGSFTVAQIVYATIFIRLGRWQWRRTPLAIIPMIIAGVVGSQILPQTEGIEFVGVGVYIAVIATMSVSAMLVERKGWGIVAMGALLFVGSDSIIAWNRFVEHIPHAGTLIMSTYYAAQALLGGYLVRLTDKPHK